MYRILILLFVLSVTGCTPSEHSISPYDEDETQALQLETRANDACQQKRGANDMPTYTFTTDGCSVFPDSDWVECCITHDVSYWCGGSAEDRQQADNTLQQCVSQTGHDTTGSLMYYGVRMGGHPLGPFSWRWGYGWDWPYEYDDND